MGCVSSNLLNHEDEFTQLGSSALSHHIVSLTSSTYGLLTLDPPQQPPSNRTSPTTPPTPALRFAMGPAAPGPSPSPEPKAKPVRWSGPEVINSWELMAGLDAVDSFRFSPIPIPIPIPKPRTLSSDKENSNPNFIFKPLHDEVSKPNRENPLDKFERICPPGGENKLVLYTTTLRGVRRTFEACNAVRAVIEGFEVAICERDISMDRGFRDELKAIFSRMVMKNDDESTLEDNDTLPPPPPPPPPPQVFVKGRYVGGAEEVLRMAEEGVLGQILEGLPRRKSGSVCEGCGDVRFLPCFQCNGSCKMAVQVEDVAGEEGTSVVLRCPDCNENGLVLCPICS